MKKHVAFISIGSNLGDKLKNCIDGIGHLNRLNGTSVAEVADFYKTAPVDYENQDWFVNSALRIETDLEPETLMSELKSIERKLGQYTKSVRFGPRILDLDIILYDEMVIDTETVTIPHPRMHKRCFVLKPLCDIAPDVVHPIFGLSVRQMLGEVESDSDQEVALLHRI